MWTLGREREKEHARQFLGPGKDPSLLEGVIDAVHDLLEGAPVHSDPQEAFRRGIVDGASGTWESTGSWLLKTQKEFPGLGELWVELARHPSAKIRFRVATFVTEIPEAIALRILPGLLQDPSEKVRARAAEHSC